MQKRHSSIVPPLQLTALLSEKAKNATALKVRFTSRFSLSDMVKQPTSGLSSDRPLADWRQQQLKTSLTSADEQEYVQRYAVDPFFRLKLQSELTSLSKASLPPTPLSRGGYVPIERTVRLIEEEGDTTYRKVKQQDRASQGCEKTAFERMIRQGQLMVKRGKENCK